MLPCQLTINEKYIMASFQNIN